MTVSANETTARAEATARPWAVGAGGEIYSVPEYASVAMVLSAGMHEANAALIVQAVNERESLLAERDALREALDDLLFQISLTAIKRESERDALQVTVDRARTALSRFRQETK